MTKRRCPVKRLDLGAVSANLYDALDWLARNGILGCTAEQVALFLLTKEVSDRLTSGEFERDQKFKLWLDREMVNQPSIAALDP